MSLFEDQFFFYSIRFFLVVFISFLFLIRDIYVCSKGAKKRYTARRFVLAVGGRPVYPEIPGKSLVFLLFFFFFFFFCIELTLFFFKKNCAF